MDPAIPLPEMGHRWLDKARARLLQDPSSAVVMEHSGKVLPDLIPELLNTAESYSRASGDHVAFRKRLIHVLVESMDNMSRHTVGILGEACFALLARYPDEYRLITGNAVPAATAVLLSHRVDILNSMPPEDLREHYLKLLANNNRSANGGAGLGLLTLARKSMPPIITRSEALGPFTSFFTFEMKVGGTKADH